VCVPVHCGGCAPGEQVADTPDDLALAPDHAGGLDGLLLDLSDISGLLRLREEPQGAVRQ